MTHYVQRPQPGWILLPTLLLGLLAQAGCSQRDRATPKAPDAKTANAPVGGAPAESQRADTDGAPLIMNRTAPKAGVGELAMANAAPKPDEPIEVPNGSPAELLAFIDEVRKREPQGTTRQEMLAEIAQRAQAITKAADKILATPNLDETSRVAAVNAKLSGLANNLRSPGGLAALRAYVAEVAKDKDPKLAATAQQLTRQLKRVSIMMGDDSQGPDLLAEIKSQLAAQQVQLDDLADAADAAQSLEMAEPPTLAIEAYKLILKALDGVDPKQLATDQAKSTADTIREMADSAVHRLEEIGKPLQVEGTFLDGRPIDWSKYRGKVVLVDFWATWCGPCVAEIPNVKENYDRFHDKGFDVLGVSLDDNKEQVTEFLKQQAIPWSTLFSDDPQSQGWSNPLAKRYNISAIPATFLVDREGKLVSMSARGERLTKKLEQLLGTSAAPSPSSKP